MGSDQMAYAMYLADWQAQYNASGPMRSFASANSAPKEWGNLSDEEQKTYLRHAETAYSYLFEHGRVIAFIPTPSRFRELRAEWKEYLATREKEA